MSKIGRRDALKLASAGIISSSLGCAQQNNKPNLVESTLLQTSSTDSWVKRYDRTWLGGEFWANPMEDWCIKDGWAECLNRGGNRSVHALRHQYINVQGQLLVSVRVQRIATFAQDGGAGIRIGVRSDLNEYKSNCFVQQGLDAGIINNQLSLANKRVDLPELIGEQALILRLSARPQLGAVQLVLEASLAQSNQFLAKVEHLVAANEVLGNVALVSNFSIESVESTKVPESLLGCRYRFSDWTLSGDALCDRPDQDFGPILWTMYSLSDSRTSEGFVVKLSALTGPLGEYDNKIVELQVQEDGRWLSMGEASLDKDAWVATFRLANWNEKQDKEFRVVYREKLRDGTEQVHFRSGIIKANPSAGKLRMAALTCQNDYGFPYAPVADNVLKLNPDLVFFSGDQIYESHGGFGIVRAPAEMAILNYLRKYYQFGWAFGEAMRNQPTICLPDDHDVLQGNLWGEGGAAMSGSIERDKVDADGGYIQTARMLNVVHRSHTAHHPDPYDPTPTPSGLSVYFGEMIYGDVGFAILADRQWKSGPERVNVKVGVTGEGEEPSYINPAFDPGGLQLLGERQEDFLRKWGQDWRGHKLKAVLSQTVFAGISTHQPEPDRYLKYDFDSSGWPASARNRAVEIMRESMALHICGDTHLGSLSQYGVQQQRDSNWAFCTPAISAGWPRWWLPDDIGLVHSNRPAHGRDQTGEYLDSFGNKIFVYAVANPEVGKSGNRYIKAHEKGSGFGFIRFDTKALVYTMDAYKFLVDVSDGNKNNQFTGWPVSIHQEENIGKNHLV